MRRLIVEADGGSRGNPGPAGYGALVRDAGSGEVLAEVAEGIGATTNNVAEYRGMIAGMEAATEVDPHAEVEVRLDSKLVVEQMSGRWKVNHPDLRPLARSAARLAGAFGGVTYTWIPRARNARADRLANEAMDAAAAGRAWQRRSGPGSEAPGGAAVSTGDTPGSAGEPGGGASEGAAAGASGGPRASGWMAPSSTPTTTVLLRHGATPLSAERRFSGRGGAELTEAGMEQARLAAARVAAGWEVAAVVTSPLARAHQTAEVVAARLGLPVAVLPDLVETDFGKWEGLTFTEVRQRWPDELAAWLADPEVAPPGGESFAEVAARVCRARDEVVARHGGVTVLAVTHVTPIKTLVRDALQAPPAALYRMHLDVGCVCELDWYADGPAVVRSLNDTAHLHFPQPGAEAEPKGRQASPG